KVSDTISLCVMRKCRSEVLIGVIYDAGLSQIAALKMFWMQNFEKIATEWLFYSLTPDKFIGVHNIFGDTISPQLLLLFSLSKYLKRNNLRKAYSGPHFRQDTVPHGEEDVTAGSGEFLCIYRPVHTCETERSICHSALWISGNSCEGAALLGPPAPTQVRDLNSSPGLGPAPDAGARSNGDRVSTVPYP
ncbi:hypothetical protein STEG23_027063, partial [Scotinomys teguina]